MKSGPTLRILKGGHDVPPTPFPVSKGSLSHGASVVQDLSLLKRDQGPGNVDQQEVASKFATNNKFAQKNSLVRLMQAFADGIDDDIKAILDI